MPQERQGWQRMRTAPRDGTQILVRYRDKYIVAEWNYFAGTGKWVESRHGTGLVFSQMVAWRPIHPFPNDWPGQ